MTEQAGADDVPDERVLVIIPTYNESQTMPVTVGRVRAEVSAAHVLVVDDGSPDGTGELADALAGEDDHVFVMHRIGKLGLGTAYVAGFRWALERGYTVVVEMDADGSHRAQDLPRLLAVLGKRPDVDLVLGSRWVPGGKVVNWPRSREFLSRGANLYTRVLLGLGVGDATGGFRAYRSRVLRRIDLATVDSQGYCFQVDMVMRVKDLGCTVVEVPITFVERTAGVSKMSRGIIVEALWRVTAWGLARRARQVRGVARRPSSA